MTRRIRRNTTISLVVSSLALAATAALTPAATAAPAPGTCTVKTEASGSNCRALSLNDAKSTLPSARIRPRTGDGPLEATKEGQNIVMRVPLETGGRLVIELSPDEASALADSLNTAVSADAADQ
ncbi:hypothetical protein Slala03_78030 [Streptomyces lavendulae subsp. lavendulae]|nr:hypothetical protein Slala03_78030 [Streptomyces lavendulae subsp. lavendulae]